MPGTHNQGPIFQGFQYPGGVKAAQGVARFGGSYGATTQSALPSGARQPFGVYTPDAGVAFSDTNRGIWDSSFALVCDFIPAALSAALIAASQSPAAGAIVLASANVAGAGTPSAPALTIIKDPQQRTRLRLDTPRAIRFVSGGNDSGITFTVTGFDEYGAPMTETVTGANIGTATGKKAWFDIVAITHTGSVAGTLTIGTTDIFGLPYRADRYAFTDFYWVDVILLVAQFLPADTTSPATAITGDVRGTYTATSASDGTKAMQIFEVLPQAANSDITKVYGVTQF